MVKVAEEMKRSRQDEIDRREREARDLQKKRFGPNGDLFKKRQELIQPIQDRVYNAVKEVAGTNSVAVFDIGGQSSNLLFASEKYDKSDTVLRKLGIRPGQGGDDDDEKEFGDDPAPEGAPTKDSEQKPNPTDPKSGGQDMKQPR